MRSCRPATRARSVTPADLCQTTRPRHFANFTAARAIGAVSRSIEQIKSQAVVELDPALIDPSPIADRLPIDRGSLARPDRDHP